MSSLYSPMIGSFTAAAIAAMSAGLLARTAAAPPAAAATAMRAIISAPCSGSPANA